MRSPNMTKLSLPSHAVHLTTFAELELYVLAFGAGHLNLLMIFGPPMYQPWVGTFADQRLQPLPSCPERQHQQRLETLVEQIEDDVGGRECPSQGLDLE